MSSLCLIEVPYDNGRFQFRMGKGPRAIFQDELLNRLRSVGHSVATSTAVLPDNSYSEAGALVELQRQVVSAARHAIEVGARPIIFSGNCGPAALGAVSAIGSEDAAVIWFDAHADFNTPETTPSGFLDGMGLAILTGRCWKQLTQRLESFRPLAENRVIQIGVRHWDDLERKAMEESLIRQINSSNVAMLPEKLANIRFSRLYLHLDVDVLDLAEGRANLWACNGGLTAAELYETLEEIARRHPITISSITSYDPEADSDGRIRRIIHHAVEILAG